MILMILLGVYENRVVCGAYLLAADCNVPWLAFNRPIQHATTSSLCKPLPSTGAAIPNSCSVVC